MCGHTPHTRSPLTCVAIDKLDISAPVNYTIGKLILLHLLSDMLRIIKDWNVLLILRKYFQG